MQKGMTKRLDIVLTPAQKRKIRQMRKQIASEMPDSATPRQKSDRVQINSFCGQLRRALHAFPMSSEAIAKKAGIGWFGLNEFVTREKSLTSDVFDRLFRVLGLKVTGPKRKKEKIIVRRMHLELTPGQKRKIRRIQKLIAQELPDLIARNQLSHRARKGNTFSAELRRAIHTHPLLLPAIAARTETDMILLDKFLTGQEALTTDVLDRLFLVLDLKLTPTKHTAKPRKAKAS